MVSVSAPVIIGIAVAVLLVIILVVYFYYSSVSFTKEDEGKILRCQEDGGIYKVEGGKARHFPDQATYAKHVPSGGWINDTRVCGKNFPKGDPMK